MTYNDLRFYFFPTLSHGSQEEEKDGQEVREEEERFEEEEQKEELIVTAVTNQNPSMRGFVYVAKNIFMRVKKIPRQAARDDAKTKVFAPVFS
jgi:hypothetical protein